MKTIIRIGNIVDSKDNTLPSLATHMIFDKFTEVKNDHKEALMVVHENKDGSHIYMTLGNSPPELFIGGREVFAVFAPPEAQDPQATFMIEHYAEDFAKRTFQEGQYKIGKIDSTDKPNVRVSVAALIYNNERQILLGHIAKTGLWSFPEGSMQVGESLESAVKRIVKGSTGLDIGKVQVCALVPYVNSFFEQAGQHFVTLFLVSEYLGGLPVAKHQLWDKFEWCNPDLPPDPLHPTVHQLIDMTKKSLSEVAKVKTITLPEKVEEIKKSLSQNKQQEQLEQPHQHPPKSARRQPRKPSLKPQDN